MKRHPLHTWVENWIFGHRLITIVVVVVVTAAPGYWALAANTKADFQRERERVTAESVRDRQRVMEVAAQTEQNRIDDNYTGCLRVNETRGVINNVFPPARLEIRACDIEYPKHTPGITLDTPPTPAVPAQP